MKNAIEKAAIAKNVTNYIIDHLLVEEPVSYTEFVSIAKAVAADMKINDAEELDSVVWILLSGLQWTMLPETQG